MTTRHVTRNWKSLVIGTVLVGQCICASAQAAIESRDQLKTYFETGDIPTEEQFGNLIDSFLVVGATYGPSISEHSLRLLTSEVSVGLAVDALGLAQRLSLGETFDPTSATLAPSVSLGAGSNWPGESGYLPFVLEIADAGQNTLHAGFVQLSVDDPGSSTPYAIRITGVAYETTPGQPIQTFHVPEPSTLLLLSLAALLPWKRRR